MGLNTGGNAAVDERAGPDDVAGVIAYLCQRQWRRVIHAIGLCGVGAVCGVADSCSFGFRSESGGNGCIIESTAIVEVWSVHASDIRCASVCVPRRWAVKEHVVVAGSGASVAVKRVLRRKFGIERALHSSITIENAEVFATRAQVEVYV